MASSDLKSMAKAALEKNKVFFDEAMEKLADLRFYASRFGGSCDDLLIKHFRFGRQCDPAISIRALRYAGAWHRRQAAGWRLHKGHGALLSYQS